MDASNKNMASADSEEEYSHYDEYEEYAGSGKCKRFINNTSAVKPVVKKPIIRVKPVKKKKVVEKPLSKQPEERKKIEEEVVDCCEDLL